MNNNMAPPLAENSSAVNSNQTVWLNKIHLENAIQAEVGEDFHKVLNLKVENAKKEGENYFSLLLRLQTEVELVDGKHKTLSFILKAQHGDEMFAKLHTLRLFPREEEIYHTILPRFEQLYLDAGKTIRFAPKAYKLDYDIGVDYVLMEDLLSKSYKHANRVKGLDMIHTEEVLKKMSEYHAASACYVERYGQFEEDLTVGVFSETNRGLLKDFNNSATFLAQLKKWPNCKSYYEKLADSDDYLVDRLLQDQKVNLGEFNVLNHGDCWSNNIMFQYDAFGKIKSTLFMDFAVGKYGSAANDLYNFLLSSCSRDIKLTHFEYFVRFYYDHLIENLKLLQYMRPLPKLTNIHGSLLRNGLAAFMIVSKVLPAVILEKTDSANLKYCMFNNPKYVQAMSEILPWLDNRGLLNWK